jgi:multiple sugar transport system permease protein
MSNTAVFTVAAVPLLVIIPLLLAMLLNQKLKGVNFFRAVFFAPYVLGVAVIGVVWRYLLDPQNGVLNGLLALVGLPSDTPWTVDVPAAWVTLVGVTVWWVAGFNIVIYLAGLKGINQELYEAAAIDGAGPMRQFWSVTIPGLRPVLAFVTTTTILSCANVFGQPYLLTQGGPGHATRSAIQYIANQGLEQNQMGSAAAMSYLLFLVLAIISVINFRLQSRTSGE